MQTQWGDLGFSGSLSTGPPPLFRNLQVAPLALCACILKLVLLFVPLSPSLRLSLTFILPPNLVEKLDARKSWS
ncbi:hypothetical protein E2C01_056404 [Portunus trituberculatus]|uniref:Uncharacterized protein n=1 Tax=Portunus trituberculatus TaxID=210409 RepID=A0A5B7GQI9_PORTR|nr:hypothetical protein [Portunus trituberculatus]